MLFSAHRRRKPGPTGPSAELIRAVVEMKQRNRNWGCPRIAQQLALAFNIPIDKDVVRRILAHHYRPVQPSGGPSWLTFLGHMKDSLWSMDLFRCESVTLRTHWVLVVIHPLRSPVPSLRGETNRHHSTRVFRSHLVLDDGRSGKQAARFQELLQPPSHAYRTGGANARSTRVRISRQSPLVSLATSLPILISDANGCLTTHAHCGIRSTSAKTWNEIIGCLHSWLQRVSRI